MIKNVKRLGVFCCLSLVLFVVIFHQILLTFAATWFLQVYSVSKWGKPLEYERISLKGTHLEIFQPRLEHDSHFTAEHVTVDFHLNWLKRKLDVDIDMERPHWDVPIPFASQWEKWEKIGGQEKKWFKVHPHFRVKAGLLTWTLDDSSQYHVHVDLEGNRQQGGFIKLYFDPQELTSNSLILQALSTPHGMEVNCNCQQVSCSSLVALAQFVGMPVPPVLVTSGSVQGELKAIFPGIQRPYLEGELLIEQLTFHPLNTALKGHLEQARLKLEKNQIAYEQNHQVPTIRGQLDILKPASLTCDSLLQKWALHQIQGSVKLDDRETALIDLEAEGSHSHHSSQWKMEGRANLSAQRSFDLDLTLWCSSVEEANGKLHLSLHQLQENDKRAEVQLEKLSHTECDFLQTLLAMRWPVFNEIKLEDGEFNALVEANMTNQGIGALSIKQFQAFHVCSRFPSWSTKCDFKEVRGQGNVDLKRDDFWQSFNASLHLEKGELQFEGFTPQLPLTDIQAHVLIQQGHVENSLVTLQVAGLKGKMDVECGDHQQLLTFKLEGKGQDVADLLPTILQEGLRQNFYHNRLILFANLKRQNQQIELDGSLHVQRDHTDRMDVIHFGCELRKIEDQFAARCVPFGWFHAQSLPLEKFLSPFIFPNGMLHISGETELKGVFDDHYLTLQYDVEDLKIENENLCFEIEHLHSPVAGQLKGSHQIDLITYSHQGTLPLQHASYSEKNSGLIFQDIQGLVTFDNQVIHILPLETYCEGIYFDGELELDYRDPTPGIFKLRIHCPTLSAKFSQIQHLLAHLYQPSFLHKIPLEGEVTAKEGFKLNFTFVPHDYQLQAEIRATLTDGFLPFEAADMALKGIDMDIDYHHQQQLLELSDIQGTLLIGKPRRVKEYLFIGHHLHVHQMSQPDIDLDIAVKDQEHELLRLVGYTQEEQNPIKSFHLNQNLSHISSIYPKVWHCQLKEGFCLEQFEFCSEFDLGNFLHDLGRFRQTGLLFFSHCMLDRMAQFLPVEGQGSLCVCYHPDQSYTYSLEGSHIKQGDGVEHYGLLKGSKKDKKWLIDQLQWDNWNAYAELQQTLEQWKIPFLGLNVGQTLLLGLEGDWSPNEGFLRAKLKFCELNLAKLDCYPTLQPFVKKWSPRGNLKATGDFEWNFLSPNPWECFKASLQATVSDLALRNYPLQVLHPFHMQIQAGQKLCLQDVKLELFPKNGKTHLVLKNLDYQFSQNCVDALQLVFQLPSAELEAMAQSVHHHFPEFLDATVKEILVAAKQQGELKGSLTVENPHSSPHVLRLKLEDGIYTFKNRKFDLKQFELQMVGNEVQFSTFSQQERCPFQMIGQATWPCQLGECRLISSGISQPLVMKWRNHPQRGWMIYSMQGEWGGCFFSLEEDNSSLLNREWVALQGQATIDFDRLSPLLPLEMAETIQKLKLGSSYRLVGRFWMNLEIGNTLLDIVSFKGTLVSEEAILKGYQFQNLQTDLQYVPGRLDIQNLSIQDPAGSIKCENLIAIQDGLQDRWTFFLPHLTVKNLRMNLLREVGSSHTEMSAKWRSLIVKRLEFQDFSGELNNLQTWQAQGNLHFLNPSRKNLHPLLAIPAEIILRLGLDPHVLNPVTGTIYFNLRDNRFYFTRFKDVYSEGRGSKFYLADGTQPSWMDFHGNLSVQVRMKQSNLILKIAELFTVSIQGNLKKPRYTLQKQSKTPHKGHILSTTLSKD